MKHLACAALFALGVPAIGVAQPAPVTDVAPPEAARWSIWGGTAGVRWNYGLAERIGLRIGAPQQRIADAPNRHFQRFEMRREGALVFHLESGHFRGFDGGSLQARGGYSIDVPGGRIDLSGFRLVPRTGDPYVLDLVSADGKAWFYIDRLMYDRRTPDHALWIRTMDVRVSPELARRLGQPMVARWAIADMELDSEVLRRGGGAAPAGSCDDQVGTNCNFAGTPAPGGGTYQADLFMLGFDPQFSRCDGCTGPSGHGTVVFTPSSSLKNNVNDGSLQVTIPNQGALGTSSVPWAADIPWYTKFSGSFPPYGNDQHPFLIWNMYRLNADGSIEQIGRSGVKHAFLTVNSGSTCPYSFGHVLGRSCEDTYGTGNNDSPSDLGPRSEIIPATNQWGRCGSIYDANCDGSEDFPNVGDYDYRLTVGEAQFNQASSSYLFESWYLARQDVNIYNSMGTVSTTQNWSGSFWGINASGYKLGPAIDRWVDPLAPAANAMNTELAVGEGHAKLAVKVTDNGDGTWRYDYAVMNLDFARAVTQGAEPNLRVVSNKGFDRFSVPLPAGVVVSATRFSDGDLVAANDWSVDTSGGRVTWTAPTATLDWGSMYAFSLTASSAPVAAAGNLRVAQAGSPAAFDLATFAPAPVASDVIFANGFDAP
ncbi:hypothetical protein FHW12_003669 [Dokdonella fugitiva]|uniref:Uncharacterized protein n=1 Tax=Dokdonella fugitiva TaxID=328517 RepID=A0A839F4C0_9GAMM|nr:hypothetical protein [Dokdonella fugitiva]MBA8889426.1 hypothetical protein [Dokdonella fugitiva]